MSAVKKINFLLIFVNIIFTFILFAVWWGRSSILENYPMAVAIAPTYNEMLVCYASPVALINIFLAIIAYVLKNEKWGRALTILVILISLGTGAIMCNEIAFARHAERAYNPSTVKSSMLDINLEELANLRENKENVLIYIGRPSCKVCAELKPNLDCLVNNSKSTVYYYNTELDRNTNSTKMQAVLDTYGIDGVPVLVVCKLGVVDAVFYDEDMISYFLDSGIFEYK
jgi:predicted bacteriocin transport accessory protein